MFVCEGANMNETNDEPDIAKDEPKVAQDIVVASDIVVFLSVGFFFWLHSKGKGKRQETKL
jgi:hypothetical protein